MLDGGGRASGSGALALHSAATVSESSRSAPLVEPAAIEWKRELQLGTKVLAAPGLSWALAPVLFVSSLGRGFESG